MPEPEHTPHAFHLIRDETLLHTAADGLEKAAHYLSSIRPKLYPGASSVLLRPEFSVAPQSSRSTEGCCPHIGAWGNSG